MQIALASDHAGKEQKDRLVAYIESCGHTAIDLGPDHTDSVDYPDYAGVVARAVATHKVDRGILVCGTGIGMSIAANKVAGVRAAVIVRPDFAELAREHNNLNVLCLSGRFVDEEVNREIVDAFLDTEFAAGRHERRVEMISNLETA